MRTKPTLTESQLKVIKDKYLRDAPSVEAWLSGVADNVALGEIACHPEAERWGVFDGVEPRVEQRPGPGGRSSQLRLVLWEPDSAARERRFSRYLENLERVRRERPEAGRLHALRSAAFYELMARWDFLPNSPTLMNAGRELQQLAACYVLPVPDSMEGISKALSAQALIQKAGGGTGFSFSGLRPKGDAVKKTRGVASGAISFMGLFDKMTEVVRQGGARRGANMGILHYTHPEIREFVELKRRGAAMENFNLSVAIDAAFMRAVDADGEYELLHPRDGRPVGRERAKEIFELMVEAAWRCGDPGFVVIDRVNDSGSNPTPALGRIEATNPCGEVPLLPWEPCNLGSLNLSNFMKGDDGAAALDLERLGPAVDDSVRFLDDVIEMSAAPLPEIERMAKTGRRIGLGVMGYAEALVKAGLPYDSPAALDFAEKAMRFVNERALDASEALAAERGVFPNWRGSIFDADSPHFRGQARAPRHSARTTIAPTGTIAIAAGLQGSGIEPFFGVAYTRYNARALDALKGGREPEPADCFFEVNPLFHARASAEGFFGLGEQELWRRIDANGRSVRGIREIPTHLQELFATAHDLPLDAHVRVQAAFQRHCDNGVSKTINLPASATPADVRRAYQLAYELGCKGVTIYRDGSKAQQVLNLASTPSRLRRRDPEASSGAASEYYLIQTGYGPLHVHINYDEKGPYQVFANLPPLGTEISALTSVLGITLSKYLAEGGDPIRILKHLASVQGDRSIGFGEQRVNSIAHALSIALRRHLEKNGWLRPGEAPRLEPLARVEHCPRCFSANVQFESGCAGPTCRDCGHSECS